VGKPAVKAWEFSDSLMFRPGPGSYIPQVAGIESCVIQILKLPNAIAEHRPSIKTEVYKHTNPSQREELNGFSADLHDTSYRTQAGNFKQCEVFGESNPMDWRRFDIFCTPKASPARSRVS